MHIFLTGDTQIGKSTIIRKFLAQTGITFDGLATFWESSDDGGRRLYLSRYCLGPRHGRKHCIAAFCGKRLMPTKETAEVFDSHGAKILRSIKKRDIIILDEIGRLESSATAFQRLLMEYINGSVPILGVISPPTTDFLKQLHSHEKITTIEISADNRELVLTNLLSHQKEILNGTFDG
ncbi:MAG: nucleoside-triphosphatase [Dehalococcoidia bacterium]|nr:nucleoside-triphosphatase [Dehalococcoidia bacterium]